MHGPFTYLGALVLSLLAGVASADGRLGALPHGSGGWPGGTALTARLHVQQWQWPAGYGVRIHAPAGRANDIRVGVEGQNIRIHSQASSRQAPRGLPGPVFTHFGRVSQSLTLPPDADMRRLRVDRRGGSIEIFIPRRR
jgi:hypothetical protein